MEEQHTPKWKLKQWHNDRINVPMPVATSRQHRFVFLFEAGGTERRKGAKKEIEWAEEEDLETVPVAGGEPSEGVGRG